MKNILVSIAYDGSAFHGWQIQKNAVTVQEEFQKALYKVIGERVDIKGSSRTDSGVHAYEYCISFKTTHSIPPERLVAALNTYLPKTIAAKKACYVSEDFHARYSSLGKEYVYKIYNAKFVTHFSRAMPCIIGTRSMKRFLIRRQRILSAITISHLSVRSIQEKSEIFAVQCVMHQ